MKKSKKHKKTNKTANFPKQTTSTSQLTAFVDFWFEFKTATTPVAQISQI
ncbi:hypothetical protein JXA32_12135 [Candidatus Sumerlaeota bacterium]|nr:hypothetical protein [Candidatus Sumerlaeota bacterium]